MTDYKNEYQKYADDAVRSREREEGLGRLRFCLFLAAAGPLAIVLLHLTKFEPQRWMAMGIVGSAPLAILMLIINYIRVPNDIKASPTTLILAMLTLLGAGAGLAMAKISNLTKLL